MCIFTGEGVWNIIFKRFPLRTRSDSCYTDVYDGKMYQHHVSMGFLSRKSNISLMFNTDGVPVFRSSNFSFWPLYLLINELPYRMRQVVMCGYRYMYFS